MVPGCPGTSKKISTLVLVHIVCSVFLLLGLLAWFPTRPCAAQIYSTVPYKPVKNSLVPFVYTCTAYLFFGLYTSTLCEVLCEVPFLSCDLLLCVGDGGGGGVCVAAGSGTTPEPRRATPLHLNMNCLPEPSVLDTGRSRDHSRRIFISSLHSKANIFIRFNQKNANKQTNKQLKV